MGIGRQHALPASHDYEVAPGEFEDVACCCPASGALKDNCRAVLVGSRTYGKGLIQSVYELADSSGLVRQRAVT